jgi:hypothetical protein
MKVHRMISIAFFCTMVSEIFIYLLAAMHLNVDATIPAFVLRLTSLVCLLKLNTKFEWKKTFPPWPIVFFRCLIAWNIISIVKGAFLAENYWDWKYLFITTGFALLIPFAMVSGALYTYCTQLFSLMVTRIFVFAYIAILLSIKADPARELFPRGFVITVWFFILAIPFVKIKWKIVIAVAAVVSALIALDYRTNIMRISFAFLLMIIYYFRKLIPLGLLKTGGLLLILAPFVFLFLGVTNQFNIFKPTDNIDDYEIAYDNGTEANLATDTRTFLYEEVFSSMRNNGTLLFGEGATGKYKTQYFEDEIGTNKGRIGAEVGFLTLLLYTGCIGVLLYSLILFSAVYYGIARSNNFFCKMLAIFLAFRWITFFIEDYVQYDMNFFFIWTSIGLCLSTGFRSLTDAEIVNFFDFSTRAHRLRLVTPVNG